MQQPILSICIPTYSRSEYLNNCLNSIITQSAFLDGKIEVVVSDNASEDNTEQIGYEFASKHENIKYFRNQKNIRDRNFPLALSRATGLYRRLCNDTLLFDNDSLEVMCEIIKENQMNKPSIAWTNGAVRCKELCGEGFEDYVRTMSFWLTSIACFGIWNSECENISEDIQCCDLLLWQVRKGLELACNKNNLLIVNKKLTRIQAVKNKNISYGLFKVFYQNYFTILQPYFDGGMLSLEDRNYLEKDLLFNFFADLCIKWELGAKNLQYSKTEDLKEAICLQYKDKDYWRQYCNYYKKRRLIIKMKTALKRILKLS